MSAYVTSKTKAIYRSLSAKVTIFIQVCRELWEFAGDGERYNEKIVHSFLPELFSRWREAGANHTVTVVLISRVFYDPSEISYAEGPLRQDQDRQWYKDFYKVIIDLEVIHDWQSTLVSLKDSFWDFQRDILLTHHYHNATRAAASSMQEPPLEARLVGRLSYAHDGPLLEALNMGLNPTETHYIDRSLSLTGSSTIVITPGTGYYRVSKYLLRLTTTRLLDQGFALDLVSLAKPPLHRSPIFSFQGVEPELYKQKKTKRYGSRAMDSLWGGDDGPDDCFDKEKRTFWWEPFWIAVSFWDKQMDLPLRQDRQAISFIFFDTVADVVARFVARAKMHEIQMLGLLDHDVLSSIEVPLLPEHFDTVLGPTQEDDLDAYSSAADKFDMEIFALKKEQREPRLSIISRTSGTSSGSGTVIASSLRSSNEKRPAAAHRSLNASSNIPPIEESPRDVHHDLPIGQITQERLQILPVSGMSTSPSQSSILSTRSTSSTSTVATSDYRSRGATSSRPSLTSKLTSSWLFNPFRSGPSQPETSPVLASGESTPVASSSRPIRVPASSPLSVSDRSLSRSPQPMAIKKPTTSHRLKTYDEDTVRTHRGSPHVGSPHQGSLTRYLQSPINTPPRDESFIEKRRSIAASSISYPYSSSSSPAVRQNPSSPHVSVSHSQASLARRWQHMFPIPLYKHEIKWKSMVTPGCLPLTTEQYPSMSELDSSYDVFSYDFVVDPPARSFLVRPPHIQTNNPEEIRWAWALVVMRGMIALRLAQGFQFVIRPLHAPEPQPRPLRRSKSYISDDDMTPKPAGAAEALRSQTDPVYLSMSNEIHRISYTGEAIQVRRYVRRMPPSQPFEYQCLIWPKLGVGYTKLDTTFTSHGLENYGWNRSAEQLMILL